MYVTDIGLNIGNLLQGKTTQYVTLPKIEIFNFTVNAALWFKISADLTVCSISHFITARNKRHLN
jgi:hypothetical protein